MELILFLPYLLPDENNAPARAERRENAVIATDKVISGLTLSEGVPNRATTRLFIV